MEHLGIKSRWQPSYKTLERAYEDADVIALLNKAFFLTQKPVKDLEHEFAVDGTCDPNTIKANWESSKDQILKISGKQHSASNAKERKKHQFEKVIIAAGTTFKNNQRVRDNEELDCKRVSLPQAAPVADTRAAATEMAVFLTPLPSERISSFMMEGEMSYVCPSRKKLKFWRASEEKSNGSVRRMLKEVMHLAHAGQSLYQPGERANPDERIRSVS